MVTEGVALPEHAPEYSNEPNGESRLLSFIVHVWKEDSDSEEQQPNLRGHITPIPDGRRHYFTNISEIPDLITAHLNIQK